jgi:hypothetical protein
VEARTATTVRKYSKSPRAKCWGDGLMKIDLRLTVNDDKYVDLTHPMGITSDAYDHLTEALMEAGFEIADGPEQVIEP